jgi:hypothetical protein
MRPLASICVALTAFLLFSCVLVQDWQMEPAQLLPRETEVPGWRLHTPPGVVRGSAMALFLKEKMPLFQSYGLRDIVLAEYERLDDTNRRIMIEIYRMRSPLDAFGIFGRTRGFADSKNLSAPWPDAYCAGGSCCLFREQWYIRLGVSHSDRDIYNQLSPFIESIEGSIPPAGDPLPSYAYCFGKHGEREGLAYVAKGDPAHPLRAGFFMRKKGLVSSAKVIIYTKRRSEADAMREFSALVCGGEGSFAMLRSGEYQSAVRGPGERGYELIAIYRDWLFGVMDAAAIGEGEAVLRELYKELKEFRASKG